MSDAMLQGILRMPLPDDPISLTPVEWANIKGAMQRAADILPRWRPIAELPDEWKDGRIVIFRDKRAGKSKSKWISSGRYNEGFWLLSDGWLSFKDIGEFLDFDGKPMPAYDGEKNE